MELKNRQACILRNLIRSNTGMSVQELMDTYGIAKRTLYYDLKKINDWLSEGDLGKTWVSGQTVNVSVSDLGRLERNWGQRQNYFFSIEERRAMELVFIALSHEIVTVQKLEEYFDVSRNTILMDIKELKGSLEESELSLETAVKTGYVIKGEESSVRKLLGFKIQELLYPEGLSAVKRLMQESLRVLTENDIDFFELCNSIIYQYEIDTDGEWILSDVRYESLRIQMALIRSIKGYEVRMSNDEIYTLTSTLSYRSLELSAKKLRVHNIDIPLSEIYYITSLFLGIQTTDFSSGDIEDNYIADISRQMVANFERIGCLFFADREHLQKQLLHHIKPLYYRLKYAVSVNNPVVDDIKHMYPIVFDITKRSFKELNLNLPGKISDGELAYLCIYMASNLNEKLIMQGNPETEKGILIIGAENMATVTMVKEQLSDLLGITFKYSVIGSNRIREWMLEDYMLVVSVGTLKSKIHCPYLVEIDPVLTETDQRKIINVLKKSPAFVRYDRQIIDIISIVRKCLNVAVEENTLYFELFRYFRGKESPGRNVVTDDLFKDKIKKGDIISLPANTSWERAVLTAGKSLQPGEGYLCGRLGNLLARNKMHTYRIREDVLLVHCPMQGDEDEKVDVVIMVSGEGIECPDGEKAWVIIALSTIDNYAHWGLLQTIYRYFEMPGNAEGIRKCYKEMKE